CMCRPAYQSGFGHLAQAVDHWVADAGLVGIGRKDLKVAAWTESGQRIARAATWMNSADRRPHAAAHFEPGDAAFKIADAEANVIEFRRHSAYCIRRKAQTSAGNGSKGRKA